MPRTRRRTLKQRLIAFAVAALVIFVLLAVVQMVVAWYIFIGP